jgi:hypothetical protein
LHKSNGLSGEPERASITGKVCLVPKDACYLRWQPNPDVFGIIISWRLKALHPFLPLGDEKGGNCWFLNTANMGEVFMEFIGYRLSGVGARKKVRNVSIVGRLIPFHLRKKISSKKAACLIC